MYRSCVVTGVARRVPTSSGGLRGGAGGAVARGPSLNGALYKAVILVLRICYIILFLSSEAITMIMIVSLSLI